MLLKIVDILFFKLNFLGSINLVNYGTIPTKSLKCLRPGSSPIGEATFDPYKVLSKVNNHKDVKPPNFDLMTSRPKTKDSLPCYIQVNNFFLNS